MSQGARDGLIAMRLLARRPTPRVGIVIGASRFSAHRGLHAPEAAGPTREEVVEARRWLAGFDAETTIPKGLGEVSFSRASGPGGQNVNKVNSKATLRVPLESLLPLLPTALHAAVRVSPYRARATDALVIQAGESRKQQENVRACYAKLARLITVDAAGGLPGEEKEGAGERVRVLAKADNERRLKAKKFHSDKKSSRRGGFD